jgi:hypothetical protein
LVKEVLPLVLGCLKGKGGGKGTKVQGKAEEITDETRKKTEEAIFELLSKK